jgi:HEPN domain-containing protein
MSNRAPDWLRQAEADIKHAQSAMDGEYFEWSCFASQQAAEKAVKSLFYHLHGDPWGHSLLSLLQGLPEPTKAFVSPQLLDSARALDKNYIPTRYPNGFSAGAPTDYYTRKDAEESLAHAKSILAFCVSEIRQPPADPGPGAEDSTSDRSESS